MDASPARAVSDAPTEMLSEHQRLLTGSLLRTIKASGRLASDCVRGAMRPWSWSAEIAAADINLYPAWDGNVVHRRLLEDVLRSCMAAHEHGLALFELARSRRRLSVPLAAVTRAAVEAYSRAFWLMGPQSPDECVRRLASLEFKSLSYGERLDASLRRLPHEVEATTPVSEHQERLRRWAQLHSLKLQGGDPSTLAGDFLESIYPGSGAYVYFGLSGAAHSNEWATANFYDFDAGRLRRDDKMLMEYCMYVIESSRATCELMIRRFEPDAPAAERWTQAYAGALADIDGFISRTP